MSPSTRSRRSCPAEKAGPLAARMTTRVSLSFPAAVKAAISSFIIASERALRFSGVFMVMVVIWPSRATRMFL